MFFADAIEGFFKRLFENLGITEEFGQTMKLLNIAPLETERLVLRMWQPDDFDAYASMSAEPEVIRFLAADGKPMSRFEAFRSFCTHIGHWHVRGFGMFAVVERASGDFAGSIRVAERAGERLEGNSTLPHLLNKTILQYGMSRDRKILSSHSGSHFRPNLALGASPWTSCSTQETTWSAN